MKHLGLRAMAAGLVLALGLSSAGAALGDTGTAKKTTIPIAVATYDADYSASYYQGAELACRDASEQSSQYDYTACSLNGTAGSAATDSSDERTDIVSRMISFAGSNSSFAFAGILDGWVQDYFINLCLNKEMPFSVYADSSRYVRSSINYSYQDTDLIKESLINSDSTLLTDQVLTPCAESGVNTIAIIYDSSYAMQIFANTMSEMCLQQDIRVVSRVEPVEVYQNGSAIAEYWSGQNVQAVFVCVSDDDYMDYCLTEFLDSLPDCKVYILDFAFPGKFDNLEKYQVVSFYPVIMEKVQTAWPDFAQSYQTAYGSEPDRFAYMGYYSVMSLSSRYDSAE